MTGQELDEIIRELYVLPPTDFVAARDELVRQAKAAGSRQVAERLQMLRRPSRSAWMVNLLARDAAAMQQLSTLGRELREAQNELAHDELRGLAERRRRLIANLLDHARTYADEAGLRLTATVLSEIEATLQAALVDLAGALTVRNGRLVRPLSHTGFGPRARAKMLEGRSVARPAPAEVGPELAAHMVQAPLAEDELARRRGVGGLRVVRLSEDQKASSPVDDAGDPSARPERRARHGVPRAEDELAAAESAHWQAEFELADAEGAVEAADDRVSSLDSARIEARRDKVTAQRYLAEARTRQREAVTALAEARRRLDDARSRAGEDGP